MRPSRPKTPAWGSELTGRSRRVGAGLLVVWASGSAATLAPAQQVPELTAPDRLRVCADPSSLPFSNRERAGFENKIAEIVADELKVPLRYYWVPQGPGFVRNTLGTGLCDVIIGYASGADIVQHTNPYYTSTYVLVTKRGSAIDGVDRLEDPRLKGAKLGVIAATPAADHVLRLGLTPNAKTYSLLVDRRYDSPAEEALADVVGGSTDGAILWGPIGGYYASRAGEPLSVLPLHEDTRPALAFRITFGIRPNEPNWKHRLNGVIRKRQKDIDAVLASYGVPLVSRDAAPPDPARPPADGVEEGQ